MNDGEIGLPHNVNIKSEHVLKQIILNDSKTNLILFWTALCHEMEGCLLHCSSVSQNP